MAEVKVALYIRVSSEEQKREGLSIDAQLRKLKEYSFIKEWQIYKVYKDEGISGGSIKKRKGFTEMLQDSKKGYFNTILITKLDRAFRNTRDALNTLEQLNESDIDFVSINENIDTTSAIGKLFFTIISAFAQFEKDVTADRNSEIMKDKVKRGLIPSKVPYGYRAVYNDPVKKKGIVGLKKHPKESEVVLDVFQMTLEGCSYSEICKKHKIKHPQIYYNMIKNPIYMGIIRFDDIEEKGDFEPIIDKNVFESVQNLRK